MHPHNTQTYKHTHSTCTPNYITPPLSGGWPGFTKLLIQQSKHIIIISGLLIYVIASSAKHEGMNSHSKFITLDQGLTVKMISINNNNLEV